MNLDEVYTRLNFLGYTNKIHPLVFVRGGVEISFQIPADVGTYIYINGSRLNNPIDKMFTLQETLQIAINNIDNTKK